MVCYVHEQKPAVGMCIKCGKPICEWCNVEIQGKYHCKNCVQILVVGLENQVKNFDANNTAIAPQPTTVYMNAGGASSSSSSSAAAVYGGRKPAPPYPRHSFWIHLILLFLTAGVGNLIYLVYVVYTQSEWR